VTAAGRPSKPLAADAPPAAAALGAELRRRRRERGLTLAALGARTGYSPQHISSLELAGAGATRACVAALDAALDAQGALLDLLPAVIAERWVAAECRASSRRRYDDQEVDPTNRRGLLEAGASVALGAPVLCGVPARAGDVDPELPAHWTALLTLLGRHAEMFGSCGVLGIIEREMRVIAAHRGAARGEVCTELMRVEARWAAFAAWLCHHTADVRGRDAWTDRALRLAHESDYADMAAFGRGRQSKHASEARRAVEYAEAALRVRGASTQTRAWCARYAAAGHALAGATASCERRLHDSYVLLEDANSPPPPWAHGFRVTCSGTRATEARCWLAMAPAKAIDFYEDALRDWPRAEVQHGGLQRARLALACALAGQLDRAKAEGAKALAIAKQTRSASVTRELRQLGAVLRAA
jgi:transcriptional regulator with XRE-family HTH domain